MSSIHSHLQTLLNRAPQLRVCEEALLQTIEAILSCVKEDHCIFLCGNGGSYADAEHIAGELLKSFAIDRPLPKSEQDRFRSEFGPDGTALASGLERGIKAQTLASHPAFLSAMANDVSWELAFAQQLYVFARADDILVGLSTSGRSANILQAMRVARVRGLVTIGMTGAGGGMMTDLAHICIRVPASDTPRIQELHQIVYHWLCAAVEDLVFGKMENENL